MSDPMSCYCSEYQSSGIPCPPGKCPNVPKKQEPDTMRECVRCHKRIDGARPSDFVCEGSLACIVAQRDHYWMRLQENREALKSTGERFRRIEAVLEYLLKAVRTLKEKADADPR